MQQLNHLPDSFAMIKRYSSPANKFTIVVKKDGKPTPLQFLNYDADEKRRYTEVSDPDIQKQLENDSAFNVYFKLDFIVQEEQKVEMKEIEPIKVEKVFQVKEFDRFMDCKTWLYKEMNIPIYKIANKGVAVELAKELGFDVKFKTDNK